jgi:hypothetical protein
MTSDIFSIAHVSSFTGVLSDCDSFGWCTAAAITFFAGGAMRHRLSSTEFKFMMFSGGLSSYLLFDDFFMFHEQLAPQYLGLSEHDIYIVLGVMVLSYLFAFRQVILQTNFFLLFFAVSCLGMRVVTDTLSPWLWRLLDWEYLIEDGFKWLGIVSWAVYFGNTSYYFVVRHLQPREARI